MARITIEDCLKKVPNVYQLVHLAGQRTRELYRGAEPKVQSDNLPIVTALREIAAGQVSIFSQSITQEDSDQQNELSHLLH